MVAYRGPLQHSDAGFHGRQRDLRGELGTVVTTADHLQAGCLSREVRLRQGDEHLDGLAEDLSSLVAEDSLGLGVDQDDEPILVDNEHRVGRGIEQTEQRAVGEMRHTHLPFRSRTRKDRRTRSVVARFSYVAKRKISSWSEWTSRIHWCRNGSTVLAIRQELTGKPFHAPPTRFSGLSTTDESTVTELVRSRWSPKGRVKWPSGVRVQRCVAYGFDGRGGRWAKQSARRDRVCRDSSTTN